MVFERSSEGGARRSLPFDSSTLRHPSPSFVRIVLGRPGSSRDHSEIVRMLSGGRSRVVQGLSGGSSEGRPGVVRGSFGDRYGVVRGSSGSVKGVL